jgi:serine/threonine protein kinase/formylglycine-generating enzyme required for sulfatase activity
MGQRIRERRLSDPRPGDLLFGKYSVMRLLGRGGMGAVWLVRHEILRDELALKLIIPGAVIDDETLKRFALEAQVMRALSRHPHAVVVHDAEIDIDRGIIYIVMDVVRGQSVEKLLTPDDPMPLDWTTQVLEQLCDVLQEAHQRGIVHRDLSPSNLILEDQPDGRVYLRVLDFGIAKVLDPGTGVFDSVPLTEDGRFFGKPTYASPEQLEGKGVDLRSDLYSVGVLLYQFLTGRRPFHGSRAKLFYDHCTTPPPRFAAVHPDVRLPAGVEPLVRRCLAKDPKDRPQSARELARLFREAVEAEVSEPPPPPEVQAGNGEGESVASRVVSSSRLVWRDRPTPGPATWPAWLTRATWLAWLTRRGAILGLTVIALMVVVGLTLAPLVHRFLGPDLQLMSWGDGSGVPTSGKNLVIVGTDNTGQLHVRIFDALGKLITDTDETQLPQTQADAISTLKQHLPGLLPPHVLTAAENAQVIAEATSIVGQTRLLPVRPPLRPPIRPEVIAFLEQSGFQLIPGSGIAAGGFPRLVERGTDHGRLVWHQGVYLPEDYQPDTEKGTAGVLPMALVRKDGSRFLLIQGGEFVMGAFDETIKDFEPEEKPGHRVRLSSFYLQETEVTFGEFARFCTETSRDRNGADLKDGFSFAWDAQLKKMSEEELRRHPAVGVPRKLAEAYAGHVGGELPSEAQWEYAARSRGKNQLYVWSGNQFPKFVNIHNPIPVGIDTLPVGLSTDDRTEQGVLDLAGNVREWCRDVWKLYHQVEPEPNPVQVRTADDPNPDYAIRGGSYQTPRETGRSTWRRNLPGAESLEYRAKNDHSDLDLGFRVVLEILEVPESLIAGSESRAGSSGERGQ